MRWVIPGLVAVGSAVALACILRGQAHSGVMPAGEIGSRLTIVRGVVETAEGRVVRHFQDHTELQAFTSLWREHHRQELALAAIQETWDETQVQLGANTVELNARYGIDLTRAHRPLPEHRQLIANAPRKGEVVLSLADEEAWQDFSQRWQQRQDLLVRLESLREPWAQAHAKMEQLREQLQRVYNVTSRAAYLLDTELRMLIKPDAGPSSAASQRPC